MNRLEICLSELEKLRLLEKGWGDDYEAISEESYLQAKNLITYIFTNVPLAEVPSVDLCKDGSVDLDWRKNKEFALLINVNGKKISYYGHLEKEMQITNIIKSNELKIDLLEWIEKNALDINFPVGTKMYWKSSNTLAYEKIGEIEWVSLDSNYLVEKFNEKREMYHEIRPESEKPLYRLDGKLNRFGWKWPDDMVYKFYKSFMNFKL